ncbi:lysine-rich arabinogalactan protein 19-like [Punica granatum]|uniref:Lysine-rich arabinogalactan protein 19-like n=2 Tax=Punica granatum TaxID=22663 RepID=A0A6P8D9L9_PUNGR|nr:lysine-rich arabinogalactan protein 19-like [Punica granatum]PKI57233.1 hypothetical protein CRG98_022378 [Punica granatum]
MATNMIELMALLRDQNRASLSYTPPSGQSSTVDLNPVVLPTIVLESEDAPTLAMTHVPMVYPVSDPLLPPPAPTAVPLPPVAFLTLDSTMHVPSPVAMPIQPPIYTVLQPIVLPMMSAPAPAHTIEHFPFQASQSHISFSYQTPPPLNIPPY